MNLTNKLTELGYRTEDGKAYSKTIKKINDYSDDNGKFIFRTIIVVSYVFYVIEDVIVDAYVEPLNQFKLRAPQDFESLNKMMKDFEKELDEVDAFSEIAEA